MTDSEALPAERIAHGGLISFRLENNALDTKRAQVGYVDDVCDGPAADTGEHEGRGIPWLDGLESGRASERDGFGDAVETRALAGAVERESSNVRRDGAGNPSRAEEPDDQLPVITPDVCDRLSGDDPACESVEP